MRAMWAPPRKRVAGSGSAELSVSNLSVSYRGVRAVSDVSLTVPAGGCVGIVGANGAGKSSTLHGIGGLARARRGSKVQMGELDLTSVRDPAVRARLGLGQVLENRHVFPGMTVLENLSVAHQHRAGKDQEPWGRDLAMSLFPELQNMLDRKAGALSGGQQQFLAIARALCGQPRVLMLDEPTNGLAPMLIERVVEVLHELRRRGLTVLLVEQRVDVAVAVADSIEIMSKGYLFGRADPDDPGLEALVHEAYLG
jgi:ABC-type branched-subunit amino acid transport system ATPase component